MFVTSERWSEFRRSLRRISGITVPDTPPTFDQCRGAFGLTTPTGAPIAVTLQDVETLLSPLILLLNGRSCAVVPIRRTYSSELIGDAPQPSLYPSKEAVLLRERVYFGDVRNAGVLSPGTAVLFYESSKNGGRAAIIAGARVLRSERVGKNDVLPEIYRRAVIDPDGLAKIGRTNRVLATTFDNLLVFNHPIGLQRLRQLRCFHPAGFVTSTAITSEQYSKIVKDGVRT
jgi:hypothetical protein